jgi:hypothetical protein
MDVGKKPGRYVKFGGREDKEDWPADPVPFG